MNERMTTIKKRESDPLNRSIGICIDRYFTLCRTSLTVTLHTRFTELLWAISSNKSKYILTEMERLFRIPFSHQKCVYIFHSIKNKLPSTVLYVKCILSQIITHVLTHFRYDCWERFRFYFIAHSRALKLKKNFVLGKQWRNIFFSIHKGFR